VAIPLLLLAILEKHGHGEDKRHVDTNDTECSREYGVQEGVGKVHKGGDTANVRGSCEGVRAGGVGDEEWWGGGVVVAAAVELYLVSIPSFPISTYLLREREGGRTYPLLQKRLRGAWLRIPDIREVLAGLERIEPDRETDEHREDRADDDEVAVELEPAAGHWRDHRWDGDQEGEEDEDGVRNRSYRHLSAPSIHNTVSATHLSTGTR